MQSSFLKLLSPEIETVSIFDRNGQDSNLTAFDIDLVENPEAVVRPQAKLPVRPEDDWPLQWLPISGFHVRFVEQLGLYPCLNDRVVLGFDGPQVVLHLIRIYQRKGLPLGHDHYYSHMAATRQARENWRNQELKKDKGKAS
jgi:hypothetical protein